MFNLIRQQLYDDQSANLYKYRDPIDKNRNFSVLDLDSVVNKVRELLVLHMFNDAW